MDNTYLIFIVSSVALNLICLYHVNLFKHMMTVYLNNVHRLNDTFEVETELTKFTWRLMVVICVIESSLCFVFRLDEIVA